MTRRHASRYRAPADPYAASRCVNCRHLRYLDQYPTEACLVCPCTNHVIPAEEVTTDAAPTPRPEEADAARTPDAAS